jgi:hypothetical protein
MSHRTAVVVAVALAVVISAGTVGVAGALDSGGGAADDDATDAEVVGSIAFSAQTSGGTTVTVDSVTVPDGGFVTIHDSSVGEDPLGSVVGTSEYLSAGTHENVIVYLEEPLTESGTYVAMAHRDTDDDRVYDFVATNAGADGPYTDGGGAVIAQATVTVSATVSMSDQPTDGSTVVVDRVELAEGGFVTIHDASVTEGDVFDSIRGTSAYLGPGVHEDVRIELDEPLSGNATLVPMAHQDTDGDQTYDFADTQGSADGPYATGGGNAVVDTANATLATEASVTFDGGATGGNSVVVDSVFVPEGGFVTIHDGSLGDGAVFESIRGTSAYLEPGLHRDVRVMLDDPLEEDATLVPMAHRDTDGDRSYDFADSGGNDDGPYTADGGAVVAQANVTVSATVSMDVGRSDGRTVVVDSVDLSEGGFVTIHDASLFGGDALGSVVGTSEYLEAGYHEDIVITLDERLRTSQTLVPMAHRDTDGDQTYDFVETGGSADGPYTADGGAVVDTAKTLVLASAAFANQTSDDGTVTVREVTLQDGGFVTIHDASLLEGDALGSVVGTSEYLPAGTHENVTIEVDVSEGSQTLIAMPHRDTDGDETYDFVETDGSADGPYLGAGGAVVVAAQVDVAPQETTTAEPTTAEPTTSQPTTEPMDGTATMDGTGTMDGGTDAEGTTASDGGGSPGMGVAAALAALVALLIARRVRR